MNIFPVGANLVFAQGRFFRRGEPLVRPKNAWYKRPLPLPPKDFRKSSVNAKVYVEPPPAAVLAFIIGPAGRGAATNNFNFFVIWEQKRSPALALRRKIQYWAELRANKIFQVTSCEYSTVFRRNRPFSPVFPQKSRPLGAKLCRDKKKFPEHFPQSY